MYQYGYGELPRKEPPAAQRRNDDDERKKEQAAALAVRKIIQRVRIATPENYDDLRNELEEAQAEYIEKMGSQAGKVSQEAEKALHQAKQRIDDVVKKREEDARRKAAEEKRMKEEAEIVDRAMKEVQAAFETLDEKLEQVKESSKAVTEGTEAAPEAMLEAALNAEGVVEKAQEVVQACGKVFSEKREEMGETDAAKKVKKDMNDYAERLAQARRSVKKIGDQVQTVREKASKKAVALKKCAEREAEFSKHDADKDGKLNREEVAEFSKTVYDYEVDEVLLTKIMRILEPVVIEKFQRMRGMVAIAKSEHQARAMRAEEEERKRQEEEQLKAMEAVVKEVSALMGAAEGPLRKGEAEGESIKKRSKSSEAASGNGVEMPPDELKSAATSMESLVKESEKEFTKAMAKLKQVEQECAANHILSNLGRREVPRLRSLAEQLEGRIHKVKSMAKISLEKAFRQEYEEFEALRTKTVLAIRGRMSSEGKTGEQLFEELLDGAEKLAKDKFVAFLKAFGEDLSLADGQGEKLFSHVAGDAGEVNQEQFLELLRLFYKCIKGTVLAKEIDIKSKTVKRLEVHEVLECLEGPVKDETSNVQRVRCKAVNDDVTGWVTLAGNQGTTFLQPGGNMYSVVKDTVITDALSVQDGKAIRRITIGELVQVLEFAQKDASLGLKRIKGKAKLDGVVGWITVNGNQGANFLEPC